MNPIKNLIIFVFILFAHFSMGQSNAMYYSVEGRLVQLLGSEKQPVSGIKIEIPGQGSAITKTDGSFSIEVSKDLEYISLESGTSEQFLLPDRMNLPPPTHDLEIMLCCGEQVDPGFQKRIDRLNTRIKKTEKEKKLSERQIIALQKTLFDTVLHYQTEVFLRQQSIEKLQVDLEDQQAANEELAESLKQMQTENLALQNKVEGLTDELYAALEEKFLRQQEHYKLVSEDLQEYLDRLKDLRDWLVHIDNYFGHPKSRQQFIQSIDNYNAAWKTISLSHQSNIKATKNYWDKSELAIRLEAIYDYLLHDLHEDLMLESLRSAVISPLVKWSNKKLGMKAAQRSARLGATNILEQLNPVIDELEYKITTIKKDLRTDVYVSN